MKPNARILDATAGNRTMWDAKTTPFMIWIDIEKDLTVPPDFFMDCTECRVDDSRDWTFTVSTRPRGGEMNE